MKLCSFIIIFSGLRWSMTQFIMQQANLGLRNPIDIMYHLQLWMFLLVGPLAFIIEGTIRFIYIVSPNLIVTNEKCKTILSKYKKEFFYV